MVIGVLPGHKGRIGHPDHTHFIGQTPAVRYERQRPGELIHIDVKKLGRIARPGHRVLGRQSAGGHHQSRYHHGWEYCHVAVDDATRLAYVEVLGDETAATAVASCAERLASTAGTASPSSAS
jgi:hypothetical protein